MFYINTLTFSKETYTNQIISVSSSSLERELALSTQKYVESRSSILVVCYPYDDDVDDDVLDMKQSSYRYSQSIALGSKSR